MQQKLVLGLSRSQFCEEYLGKKILVCFDDTLYKKYQCLTETDVDEFFTIGVYVSELEVLDDK